MKSLPLSTVPMTLAAGVVLGLLLLAGGCSNESEGSTSGANRLIPAVEAVQAREGSLPLTERFSGLVRANNQIDVFAELSAPVTAVHVQNGEVVAKGAVLVTLRDIEVRERLKQASASLQIAQAQTRQAEAAYQEVQTELGRVQSLADQGLVSTAELENARTRAVSAEADLALARARVAQARATEEERREALSQTVVRAPVAGTVGNRNAEVGMLATPNRRLFTLGQLDSVRVEIVLTDRMLGYIDSGQRSDIDAQTLAGGPVSAPLARISPFLNPVTHSTTAEIDLANPGQRLKSGMFVSVDVFYGESETATLVPLSALYEHPATGETGVYVSEDDPGIEPLPAAESGQGAPMSAPLAFAFVPVEVVAKGRMVAGVRGVGKEQWVITLGQHLLGGEAGEARVRPVEWRWVERLQTVQREDLMQEVVERRNRVE